MLLERAEEVKKSGEGNILYPMKWRAANWIGHILCRNCLLKHVIEGNIEDRIAITGERGRRCEQELDNLKGMGGCWKLKKETLDDTLWGTRFEKATDLS